MKPVVNPGRSCLTCLLLTALLTLHAALAAAAPLYTAVIDFSGTSHDAAIDDTFSAVLEDSVTAANGSTGTAFAVANGQKTGVHAAITLPGGLPSLASFGAGGSGRARVDDLVFTNFNNPADLSPIEVSTNFRLDGFFRLLNGSVDTRASGGVSIDYGLGTGPGNLVTTIGGITRAIDRGTLTANNSGVFQQAGLGDDMTIDSVFVSTVLTVPVGVPLPLSLRLIVSANGVSRDGGFVEAETNFRDTLFFAADRPVFNLPAGYTANSVQAGILDNRLSAVPVPAAAPLLAVALTGLLAWRSRAQRPSRPLG